MNKSLRMGNWYYARSFKRFDVIWNWNLKSWPRFMRWEDWSDWCGGVHIWALQIRRKRIHDNA